MSSPERIGVVGSSSIQFFQKHVHNHNKYFNGVIVTLVDDGGNSIDVKQNGHVDVFISCCCGSFFVGWWNYWRFSRHFSFV